jgi:hypothetical protein
MSFRGYNWNRVYESSLRNDGTLISAFYRPLLSNAIEYHRLAGYLSLQNLADALQGIESAFESDSEIRIIASKRLSQENKPVLTDEAPLSEEGESRLALIAQMLDEGRLQLKDLDNIGEATSIVFDYMAQGTDNPDSVFEAGFEGSAAEFANHFGTNRIPESFIGAGGDSEGEAVLIIDTESMANNSRKATLDVLEEALESLGGINNVELVVSDTVEESSEQSEEVSA